MNDLLCYLENSGPARLLQLILEKSGYLSDLLSSGCLLYTSDAADDLTRVDLGGRRIINVPRRGLVRLLFKNLMNYLTG